VRVTRSETIAGHPALQVRALFREACGQIEGVTPDLVRRILSLADDDAAQRVIDVFQIEGYIEPHTPGDRIVGCRVTVKGTALAAARAHRPIRRGTAEQHLGALLQRVKALADREFLYLAAEVLVFGSYLGDASCLGDLDIAIRLVPTIEDQESFWQLCQERSRNANRSFKTFLESLYWPEMEVRQFLNARAHGLAVRWEIDDFIWGERFKVAYVDHRWALRRPGTQFGYQATATSHGVACLYHEHRDAVATVAAGTVRKVSLKLEQPLILDTPERLRNALKVKVKSAEGTDRDTVMDALSRWPRAGGYDAVVIPESALKGGGAPLEQPITLVFA
jgi:hypothetical protein